ncbi:hypothetical protein [Nitrosomonas ureae]|uniref:Uncharacterized protein n=1 Tax=Nitrosomonas ureae TaxID=44577 RepID=A0A0S3AH30_9PROT|nr:hypothetical protein [Nitrosomonas ureae]ALQ50485.1 hypothetical protein ATY38_04090 [Nitrosomonas ureae]PTQ86499.1 hypothetical protein C8R28_101075 [Nitrosomonas ureae]SDT86113.1 hypothetical protein SAMN05216406_1067 [Nitrosomonas ureae]SEQ64010.1 hypothetical protein SAMN05421510_11272 [Nitrosomonas ureae]SOD17752.1 hypothetical protein SAMN06297164_1333 [Nitrosomonas ureae]
MNKSQNTIFTAAKITFVLFVIVPLIGLMMVGDSPSFTVMQTEVSWIEADIVLGTLFFIGYLVFASISKKAQVSQHKINA